MEIRIRPYHSTDYPQLQKLLIDANLYYEKIDSKERIERKIAKDSKSIIIAIDGKKLIGTVFILEDNGWLAFIFHLAVDKDYRGKGIGTKLLVEAEKLIKSRNGQEVYLLIESGNLKVTDFYKKNGYSEGGLYRWMGKDF